MNQALTLPNPRDGLARLWRSYPREIVGFGLLGLAAVLAVGGAAYSSPELPDRGQAAPPAPPPLLVRQIAPEQALQVNETIPITAGPNPAARPFAFRGDSAARSRALECLASAVYYEAGDQETTASVPLPRSFSTASATRFPGSVCDVVYQGSTRATGCQFTFTCDGSLYRRPDLAGWNRAYGIASAALSGSVYAPVGYATHYHANYVVPYWASTLAKNAVVGAHIFYRWAGGWGRSGRFFQVLFRPRAQRDRARATRRLRREVATAGQAGSEVAQAIADIPGAEALPLTPSMRGDKRVAIRFNLAARKASEAAPHDEYVEKFKASDNLRWSLSDEAVAANEKPLGQRSKAPAGEGAAGATRPAVVF